MQAKVRTGGRDSGAQTQRAIQKAHLLASSSPWRMRGSGSHLWSIWQTDRWSWFTRKIFSFFKRKSPLGRFGECPLLMEERILRIRGLGSAFDPIQIGRPIFAVTHNTAPHANDVVGYGCRSQAVPLTFAPSVAIRSRRSEAFSLQGS